MRFIYSKCPLQNWAFALSGKLQTSGTLALTTLSTLALLCGCAGAVSPSSSSSATYSISGTISPASAGNGTTVSLSGRASASATGNGSGNYSFSALVNGSYIVTPSRSGYTFSPSAQTVSVSGSEVSGIDFTGAQQTVHSVALSWQASTSQVSGYNVYRGTNDGGPYSKINGAPVTQLNYMDSSVSSGSAYYYVTTSVDSAGVESGYSNQASAKIP